MMRSGHHCRWRLEWFHWEGHGCQNHQAIGPHCPVPTLRPRYLHVRYRFCTWHYHCSIQYHWIQWKPFPPHLLALLLDGHSQKWTHSKIRPYVHRRLSRLRDCYHESPFHQQPMPSHLLSTLEHYCWTRSSFVLGLLHLLQSIPLVPLNRRHWDWWIQERRMQRDCKFQQHAVPCLHCQNLILTHFSSW